jgi:hypothetical protein
VKEAAYGKSVWFWHPWLVSSWRRLIESNRVRWAANPAATEARGIRLRGERAISRQTIAQGRPDALRWTCMLVCALLRAHCTRDRGCSAHPVFPAPLGESFGQASGASRREIANVYSVVIARLDRATQYSREIDDRTEWPRRTGYPACAGYDSREAFAAFAPGMSPYRSLLSTIWITPHGCAIFYPTG